MQKLHRVPEPHDHQVFVGHQVDDLSAIADEIGEPALQRFARPVKQVVAHVKPVDALAQTRLAQVPAEKCAPVGGRQEPGIGPAVGGDETRDLHPVPGPRVKTAIGRDPGGTVIEAPFGGCGSGRRPDIFIQDCLERFPVSLFEDGAENGGVDVLIVERRGRHRKEPVFDPVQSLHVQARQRSERIGERGLEVLGTDAGQGLGSPGLEQDAAAHLQKRAQAHCAEPLVADIRQDISDRLVEALEPSVRHGLDHQRADQALDQGIGIKPGL